MLILETSEDFFKYGSVSNCMISFFPFMKVEHLWSIRVDLLCIIAVF